MEEPPVALVKTWYELSRLKDDRSVSEHARSMLKGAFDSPESMEKYLIKHGIGRKHRR